MEAYAEALSYAVPGFFVLMIIEFVASLVLKKKVYRSLDTVSSLSSGATNILKSLIGLSIVIVSYDWLLSHFAIFSINSTVWVFVVAFIGLDFVAYWTHRFNHKINIFWNRHIVHHSSEEYNLACALRQSISSIIGIYFFLYIPLAIIGIPTKVIAVLAPIHLFAQFWYHTRLINKMGFLEHIIMTPSHHRVHHAINDVYIDKNLGAIFIFWDKWFGTFQEELSDVPPVYGVKKAVKTWNPVTINFMHMWQIMKDAWHAENWVDKLRIWYMPTGWRPADVAEKYPLEIIEDPYSYEKYDTEGSTFFHVWSWFQIFAHNALLFVVLTHYSELSRNELIAFCSFAFVSIMAYTELMSLSKASLPLELIKVGIAVFITVYFGGWFGLDQFIPGFTVIMNSYVAISLIVTLVFNKAMQNQNQFFTIGGTQRSETNMILDN